MMGKFLGIMISLMFCTTILFAQQRIAFLPFQNMDGNLEQNKWCYALQDSVEKEFLKSQNNGNLYYVVPADSIEMALAELNIDPNNPQYPSDMWKAVEKLNISKVITGNFNIQSQKFLINAYIYDVEMKLPDSRFQARDLFKSEDKIYTTVPVILKRLMPAFEQQAN
jgi:TolB-like protein